MVLHSGLRACAAALICLGLGACGQTGPLVLPDDTAAPASAPANPTTRDPA